MVHGLERAEALPVTRIDRHDQDRTGAVAAARIDARIETWILVWIIYTKYLPGAGHLGREASAVQRQAELAKGRDALPALPALGEHTRPELVLRLVGDVQRRPVGVEHERRREGDAPEDLVDVRFEREVALELEQRLQLLRLAKRCHPRRFLLNCSPAARASVPRSAAPFRVCRSPRRACRAEGERSAESASRTPTRVWSSVGSGRTPLR